jgi:hypothetical protein
MGPFSAEEGYGREGRKAAARSAAVHPADGRFSLLSPRRWLGEGGVW